MSSTTKRARTTTRTNEPKADAKADLITGRQAAELTHLDPREQFYVTLWSMVQCFDPSTTKVFPLPEEYRFPLLSSSQLRRLRNSDPSAAEAYIERKARRDEWAGGVWLVVPVWGGRKGPSSEWRFSSKHCRTWGDHLLGSATV